MTFHKHFQTPNFFSPSSTLTTTTQHENTGIHEKQEKKTEESKQFRVLFSWFSDLRLKSIWDD